MSTARQTEVLVIGAGPGAQRVAALCGSLGRVGAATRPPGGNF